MYDGKYNHIHIHIYTRVIIHVCNITISIILYIHDAHIDIIMYHELYERVVIDTFKYAHYTNRSLLVRT